MQEVAEQTSSQTEGTGFSSVAESRELTAAQQKESDAIIESLITLFDGGCTERGDVCMADLMKHVCSSFPLSGGRPGSYYADLLLAGMDKSYTLPPDEIGFVDQNASTIARHVREIAGGRKITYVNLGVGSYNSVTFKTIPLLMEMGASRYVGIDMSMDFAQNAAALVSKAYENAQLTKPIEAEALNLDFTERLDLRRYAEDSLVVLGMFGDTIGQHPDTKNLNGSAPFKGVTLQQLLTNFGDATNFDALMLATIDSETRSPVIEAKYSGPGMRGMMDALLRAIQYVLHDGEFNPRNLTYNPHFDQKLSALQFSYTVQYPTTITIERKKHHLSPGMQIIVGCSQKTTPRIIAPACAEAGWTPMEREMSELVSSSSVRMMYLAGKNLRDATGKLVAARGPTG